MKLQILLMTGLLALANLAFGQDKAGNGGDMCEDRFKIVRDDIQSWIHDGGSAGLRLPSNLSLDRYNFVMTEQIAKAKVSCVSEKIFIGKAEKTCENFHDESGTPRIRCNTNRFMNTNESDQYVLVHHEYAGLSGFEVSDGEDSEYVISNQISGYLVDQVVKKLAINPRCDECSDPLSDYRRAFENASRLKSVEELTRNLIYRDRLPLLLVNRSDISEKYPYSALYIETNSVGAPKIAMENFSEFSTFPDLDCNNLNFTVLQLYLSERRVLVENGDLVVYGREYGDGDPKKPIRTRLRIRVAFGPNHKVKYVIGALDYRKNVLDDGSDSAWKNNRYTVVQLDDVARFAKSQFDACKQDK
jgi:hypothetical protein